MKKEIRTLLCASVSSLAFSVFANNLNNQSDIVPYIGADAQWRHMAFKKTMAKNKLKIIIRKAMFTWALN